MASLYKKVINGKPYFYLREMGWVDGKPKMVSERYLGSAADIVKAMDAAEAGMKPERTGHLGFGDVAAVWSLLTDLDVAGVIDEVVGARRSDAGASVGTYLALAALGRLVAPRSKKAFADWWASTAGDRFTKISPKVLDHRKFWDAMHSVDADALQDISARLAARMIKMFDLDVSSVALDMTNFATYIDTTNDKAPIAQRGKAKQKRTDLRLVGLGMVVTRAGGIPLVWHAYPGNRPDVTQFPTLIGHLKQRYTRPRRHRRRHRHAVGTEGGTVWPSMTVVFDAGQNSTANFDHLRESGLHFVGSVPPSDCPDLLALPASPTGIPWTTSATRVLTAIDTRRDRLRPGPAGRADPLAAPARRPGPVLHRHHPGQGRPATRRPRRHPGPRENPPHPRTTHHRDREDHPQSLGARRHRLGTHRRNPSRPPADLVRQRPPNDKRWKTTCSVNGS